MIANTYNAAQLYLIHTNDFYHTKKAKTTNLITSVYDQYFNYLLRIYSKNPFSLERFKMTDA